MSKPLKIVIKGKPFTVNAQYIRKKGAARYILSNEARVYGDSVGWQVKTQWHNKPLEGNLEVSFYYYFSDSRRRDHLNFNKILCDRFNQIVWQDDSQIKISHHYSERDEKEPRVEIFIQPLSPLNN